MAKLVTLGIAETAAQFEILQPEKAVQKGLYGFYGPVDFTTLTISQADNLLRFGFPYLRRKSEPEAVQEIKSSKWIDLDALDTEEDTASTTEEVQYPDNGRRRVTKKF